MTDEGEVVVEDAGKRLKMILMKRKKVGSRRKNMNHQPNNRGGMLSKPLMGSQQFQCWIQRM